MSPIDRRSFMSLILGSSVGLGLSSSLFAVDGELDRGFIMSVPPFTTGVEIARQQDIWEMEVQMKPMRLIMAQVPGQAEPQLVLYLAYRAIPRPIVRSDIGADVDPVNGLDPSPGPQMFIPQMTLVTFSDRKTEIPVKMHVDRVLPQAIKPINVIERPATPDQMFLDAVSVVRPVPEPVATDAPDQPWIYGVSTWTGVDPRTDYFKVILQGFSSVYEIRGQGAERRTWRKVLVQKFASPGDELDPTQEEFQFDGKPYWEYQPDKKSKAELTADK